MSSTIRFSIDLAKSFSAIVGVDEREKVVMK